MGALGRFFDQVPLIPTKRSIGSRFMGRSLERARGDADFVGIVKGDDGWELIPCNMVKDGEDQYGVPVEDEIREFPADGIPMQPSSLCGVPVAIGYKNFGSLNEIPNNKISRNVVITVKNPPPKADVSETVDKIRQAATEAESLSKDVDERLEEMSDWEKFTAAVRRQKRSAKRSLVGAGRGLRRAGGRLRDGLRNRLQNWEERKGWQWMQGDANALVIEQDGDSKLVMERADYQTGDDGPDWYEARHSGYFYDARGAGAPPTELLGADMSTCHAQTPKLLAPVLCRLARNMHERRIVADEVAEFGGQVQTVGNGNRQGVPVTDGGQDVMPDGGTQAKTATASRGDIMVEERAFVSPEDVKLLGGAQETQDKINTLIKQVEAKANTPGGTLGKRILDFGKIVIAFILGSVLTGGGGGGGGGGEDVTSVPIMIDPSPLMEVLLNVPV